MNAGTFAAVFVVLYVAHQVADHWVQTEHQAATKGRPGWQGRVACAAHVGTYVLTALVLVSAVALLLPLDVSVPGVLAGQVVSGVTHYWADRRATLQRLAELVGKAVFYRLGAPRAHLPMAPGAWHPASAATSHDNPSLGTGAYALDQSWHVFWLFVAALVTVALS